MHREKLVAANHITFEHPMDELAKVSLKICCLTKKIPETQTSLANIEVSLNAIVELLAILERPDLRGKYFQCLSQALHNYQKIQHAKQICQQALTSLLTNIEQQLHQLSQDSGRFAKTLLTNPFFNGIKQKNHQQMSNSAIQNPLLQLWLAGSLDKINQDFQFWHNELSDIQRVAQFHKYLMMKSSTFKRQVALKGYAEQNIEQKCQLIRVRLPIAQGYFPTFSAGHRGIGIQFMQSRNVNQLPTKVQTDLEFEVAHCY